METSKIKYIKGLERTVSLLAVVPLLIMLVPVRAAAMSVVGPNNLFFSEYIEGSSNNKALEIYNPTTSAVNLSGYSIEQYFNGATTATPISLSGTIAAGDVYVVCSSFANTAILGQCDQTYGSAMYNGNDAVALQYGSTALDVIGQIGFNPGTEWGTGLTSTADNTLVRKCSVTQGDTNGSDAFDPAIEWDGYTINTFSDLGLRSCDITPPTIGGVQNDVNYDPAWWTTDFNLILMNVNFDTSGMASAKYQINSGARQDITLSVLAPPNSHAGETWGYIPISDEGENTVTVELIDGAGNIFHHDYTVRLDKTAPTVTASAQLFLPVGGPYTFGSWTNQGVAAFLNGNDGSGSGYLYSRFCTDQTNTCTPNNFGPIIFDTEGVWYLRFFGVDSAGNVSNTESREVKIDRTAPVINLNGGNTSLTVGQTFNDLGASTDDGSAVMTSSTVDTALAGSYIVRYNSTDAAGNAAKEVSRTVTIIPAPAAPDTNTYIGTAYTEIFQNGDFGSTDSSTNSSDNANNSNPTEVKGAQSTQDNNIHTTNVVSRGFNWDWVWYGLSALALFAAGFWYMLNRRKNKNHQN